MDTARFLLAMLLVSASPALATVTISSPANNSSVSSPVDYQATASSACSTGIAAMGVYVNNKLVVTQNGASLSASVPLNSGYYNTVVQEWDNCGGSTTALANITVGGGGQPSTTTAVAVSSPANNSTVSSPVTYSAKATTATCANGIAAMGVYVDNTLAYQVNGSVLQTSLALSGGAHRTVVQAWDNCGGAFNTVVNITVGSATTTSVNLSASPTSITAGSSSVLNVSASNAAQVTLTGSDGSSYPVATSGGQQTVTPQATITYTATATSSSGSKVTSSATVTVSSSTTTAVAVSSPANNSTVSSPVTYSAKASTATCASGVAAMGVYVDNTLAYSVNGAVLQTSLALSGGAHRTVVQAWDNCGGSFNTVVNISVGAATATSVNVSASPTSVTAGSSSVLTVTAANAADVTLTGSDNTTYTVSNTGGQQTVTPTATTTYTATATSSSGSKITSSATVTVGASTAPGGSQAINHVIFMLQENHSFDNYFGMLNPYRVNHGFDKGADGQTYAVDGIDNKLTTTSNQNDEGTNYSLFKLKSTCLDDMTSSWLESYGDINRYDFSTTRGINMDGFVHTAENFAKSCLQSGGCSGAFSDVAGQRAMGYYDETFLNYYYYMASQFAVSDRWFSPISSKSIPNRIVTFSGGTSEGLAFDPGSNDHLPQLGIATIFSELDQANVPWKIYYTTTQGGCLAGSSCAASSYPDTILSYFSFANRYLNKPANGAACVAPTVGSSAVGDPTNSFCIDPAHIVPLPQYYTDVQNKTLPSFSFIEAGAGHNDEHPGSGQSVLAGQNDVAKVVNGLMSSPSWSDSAFFLSYDEGGGPYDHVPPVPYHSNQNTDAMVGSASVSSIPDISTIAVNADGYGPCLAPGGVPTQHCDLTSVNDPGGHSTDAAAQQGFAAQLGFRVPNLIISPFTRKHYVGHAPMDHTAVLKFVENRFIGPSAHLTARDAAQPDLLDFFDFSSAPWATPPAPPAPVTPASLGYDPCTPQTFAP
jgi:phospholipase C